MENCTTQPEKDENTGLPPEETQPGTDSGTVSEVETVSPEEPKDGKKEKKLREELTETKRALTKATEAQAAKEKEAAELKDKYLRMMAEYDNFRKRSAKERDGIYTDAVADVIAGILPVADNLERAAFYGEEPAKVAEGLAMTAKSLADLLGKLGVEIFGDAGDIFDPNLHHAIMHVEDEEHKEGEILEVFQRGYRKGDKVIRYAMVKVAN